MRQVVEVWYAKVMGDPDEERRKHNGFGRRKEWRKQCCGGSRWRRAGSSKMDGHGANSTVG